MIIMNRKIMLVVTMLTIGTLVSSVTATNNLEIKTIRDNQTTQVLNLFDGVTELKIYKDIEQKIIEKFGIEFKEEYHFKMKLAFCDNLDLLYCANYDDNTVSIHNENQAFEGLFDLTIMIMYTILLLFGHNLIGDTLAVSVAMVILVIPCIIVAFQTSIVMSFDVIAMMFFSMTGVNLEQFIYDWGLIGLGLFSLIGLPIMFVISIILFPFLWLTCTFTNMIDCLMIALEMLNTKTVTE